MQAVTSQKLTTEELQKLQEMNTIFNKLKMSLADNVLQQESILANISAIKADFIETEKSLMDKYGKNITLNLQTGEVVQKEPQMEVAKGS